MTSPNMENPKLEYLNSDDGLKIRVSVCSDFKLFGNLPVTQCGVSPSLQIPDVFDNNCLIVISSSLPVLFLPLNHFKYLDTSSLSLSLFFSTSWSIATVVNVFDIEAISKT